MFDLAHPAVRSFTDREGLPQNTVYAIVRDALGYLWVGTQDGAARWNGREWLIVDMPDREVSNYIRSLAATRDWTLWFGREAGGLVRLRRDPLHPVPRRESFAVFGEARGWRPPGSTAFRGERRHDMGGHLGGAPRASWTSASRW